MSERISNRFQFITSVGLMIGYDNGMINRLEPEGKFIDHIDSVLGAEGGPTEEDLRQLDQWLESLTQDERETLAMGAEHEVEELRARAPNPEHVKIFDDIFDCPFDPE